LLVPTAYTRRENPLAVPLEPVYGAQVSSQNAELVAGWCHGRVDRSGGGCVVYTADSAIPARVGDYIVLSPVNGRWFPMRRATFELAYQPIDPLPEKLRKGGGT
jgi:hypothetical protein